MYNYQQMGERLSQNVYPEKYKFPFSRSLHHTLTTDYLPSLNEIGALLIPDYNPTVELTSFPDAFRWVQNNPREFLRAGFTGPTGTPLNSLPKHVLNHDSCISLWLELTEDMLLSDPWERFLPVTYIPGSLEWETDFRLQTDATLSKIKNHPLESRTHDPKLTSTSRTISIIQIAFNSGWKEKREEACDLLTAQLFRQYWVTLKRRIKQTP